MDNIIEIFWGAPTTSYIANLCMHIKTEGVHKSRFTVSPFDFEVYDVGGTRAGRKKWIHCIGEQPDHIIHVVDLNGYCQNLAEDLDAVSPAPRDESSLAKTRRIKCWSHSMSLKALSIMILRRAFPSFYY